MANLVFFLCAVITMSVHFVYADDGGILLRTSSSSFHTEPDSGIEMVFVKGGCYQMGVADDDGDAYQEEFPAHEVCVDNFYMGRYEVTQGQWKSIMGSSAASSGTCAEDNCPVDTVSWVNVQAFISNLNRRSGGGKFRLPSEAEWEYAARSGGKREKYSGGNTLDSVAWYSENSGRKNHPVGTKTPNGLGIYDMSGNVWEWTNDWYGSAYYKHSLRNNPSGPLAGVDRVVRGGCSTGEAANQRVSRRTGYAPDFRKSALGFRILKIL
ncbi:MAG TPA: formylglycine-generating enzyme family protein [Desulfuromonadales bacterium]|nr:formylglycine-generating enzyme family protein [Desulfuromonadales bacterium]